MTPKPKITPVTLVKVIAGDFCLTGSEDRICNTSLYSQGTDMDELVLCFPPVSPLNRRETIISYFL